MVAVGSDVEADFFADLADEGCGDILSPINVAANGCVPTVGLNVLPRRTMLEEKLALGVENVEVYDGMKWFSVMSTVSKAASCLTDDVTIDINNGE